MTLPLPNAPKPAASRVYDVDGQLITYIGTELRVDAVLAELPAYLTGAVVAIEDFRFYRHPGFDPAGLARALVRNLQAGRIVEGGSTITSQLARNRYLTLDRTAVRKLQEAFLTVKLEARRSKDQILEEYLNIIYFGHGANGIEVAARVYFGKAAAELDLAESAVLGGIKRSPASFSPYLQPERARDRRNFVLARMVELEMISPAQAEQARQQAVVTVGLDERRQQRSAAAYFIDFLRYQLRQEIPEVEAELERGDFRIYTTMKHGMQRAAFEALNAGLGQPARRDDQGLAQPQGALVAIDPRNGHIRALVGGRSFAESQFNRAYQARRQPGSAFKPFLYVTLIDAGIPVTTTKTGEPVEFSSGIAGQPYRPQNFGPEPFHLEHLTVRDAIRRSDNVVAVKWAHELGVANVIRSARRMGISPDTPLEASLPLVLGASEVTPLELTTAYAPLANLGHRVKPMAVRRVEGPDGQILLEQRSQLDPVLNPATAYLMTDLLKSVLDDEGGTGHHLRRWFDRPAAGKTGTTNERRDAWFVGYTPALVAAVYVGDDGQAPLPGGGGALAGPIWASFMNRSLTGQPNQDWRAPTGILSARACILSGPVNSPQVVAVNELFRAGTYTGDNCRELWQSAGRPPDRADDALPPESPPAPDPQAPPVGPNNGEFAEPAEPAEPQPPGDAESPGNGSGSDSPAAEPESPPSLFDPFRPWNPLDRRDRTQD
ncbi:MAG: PBP1A family penicillin-binding protein [Thermaerobacterales bacterium]